MRHRFLLHCRAVGFPVGASAEAVLCFGCSSKGTMTFTVLFIVLEDDRVACFTLCHHAHSDSIAKYDFWLVSVRYFALSDVMAAQPGTSGAATLQA